MNAFRKITTKFRHRRPKGAPKESPESHLRPGIKVAQGAVPDFPVERSANHEGVEQARQLNPPPINQSASPTGSEVLQDNVPDQPAQVPSAELKPKTDGETTGSTALQGTTLNQPARTHPSELRPKTDEIPVASGESIDMSKSATLPTEEGDPHMKKLWDDASKELMDSIQHETSKEGVYTFFGKTIKFQSVDKQDDRKNEHDKYWVPPLPLLTLPEVLQQLNEKLSSEDLGTDGKQTKNYAEQILGFLQPVGGLLAQVASAAFPPSQICFTAVCHALNTAQLYHEHFADLSALFQHISWVLERFEVHSRPKPTKVEPEDGMHRILRELLRCFVQICVVAARLSRNKKREKIKTAISLFVTGQDTEFKDLLQRIDDLSLAEMGFSIAENTHITKHIDAKVTTLWESNNEADKQNKKLSAEKRWRDSIKDALHIIERDLNWKTACDTYLRGCADGTGDWLIADPSFQRWSSIDKIGPPILTLEAPDSHGKTYLSARIIDTMRKKYWNTAGTARQHVAYCFCDKNQKDAKGDSVRSVLTSWLWQLTEKDPSFLKFVADVCKEPTGLSQDPVKLWTDTFAQYAKKKISGATLTFFLILDGANHIDGNVSNSFSEIAKMVANQKSDVLRVKLLVTGTAQVLNQVRSSSGSAWARIYITEKNENDIRAFVNRRLDAYKWHENGPLERSRGTIVEALLGRSQDFSILNGILTKIESLFSLEEILKAIEEESTVKSAILKLDNELDPNSLEEFNEILPWIILPWFWPSVRQIMAVISLKRGQELDSSYEDQLLRKYPFPLLEIEDGDVVSRDTWEYFQEPKNHSPLSPLVEEMPEGSTRMTQLHPSEVLVIENIVRQACGTDLYKRFEFDEFFNTKRGLRARSRIVFNPIDGRLRIAVSCLKALGDGSDSNPDEPERSSKSLHDYAIRELPEHLKELASADLEDADVARKGDLGTHLCCLLTEELYLRTWLSPEYADESRGLWLDEDSTVLNIVKLFQDRVIRKSIAVSKNFNRESLDAEPLSVLKETTAFMIRHWLHVEDWSIASAFEWVKGYYIKCNGADLDLVCHPEDVEKVVQWAKELIGSADLDTVELTRRAETMLYCSHYAEAEDYCTRALRADPTYWRASWCSIRTSYASKQPDEDKTIIQRLRNLLQDVQKNLPSFSTTHKEAWEVMLKRAETHSETLEDPKEAIDACRELLAVAPHAYNAMRILIKLLSDTKQYVAITDYLRELYQHSDEKGPNSLAKLFHYCSKEDEFHHQISSAIKTHSNGTHVSKLTQMVDSAFKEAFTLTTSEEICERVYIRYYHGLLLYYSIPDGESILRAIDLWQSNVSEPDPSGGTSIDWIRSRSARKLTEALLAVCKNSGWDRDSVEECLNRFKRLQDGRKEILGKQEDLLVARICQESEHRKADVKEWVKEYVRQALVFLKDKDKGNDWYGYQLLAEVLLPIDQENALAAWMKIGPHDRAHDTSSASDGADDSDALSRSSSDSDDSDDSHRYGPVAYICDGECGHTWTYATDMYWCRECVEVAFDEKCLKKLQAQELSWRVCRHDHDFVHVPSWDGKAAKAVDADHIQVGNEEPILVKDWVARLEHLYCEDDGGHQDEETQKNTQISK